MERVEATTRKDLRRAKRAALRAALLYGFVLEDSAAGYAAPPYVMDELQRDVRRAEVAVENRRRRT